MSTTKDMNNEDVLKGTLEYSRYLYEEENSRRVRLNDAVKVYLGFLTFILGVGVFKLLPLDGVSGLLFNVPSYKIFSYTVFGLLGLSLVLLITSFIFTIMVLKMWPYERLCNPREMALKSIFIDDNKIHLSSMISDYVVACNINHDINDKKSKLLSHALLMLIAGLILFASSIFILKAIVWLEAIQ